jgi:hypothetical protein
MENVKSKMQFVFRTSQEYLKFLECVILNQVLNHALKQVQGLTNSGSNNFRISPSGQNEMLNRVQHDNFFFFNLQVLF